MVGDETCQSVVQQAWGTERENYASIMFQYLPFERRLPTKKVGRMTYCGLVVIDFVSAYVGLFHFSNTPEAFFEPISLPQRALWHGNLYSKMVC